MELKPLSNLDRLALLETLNIIEASALIAGIAPSDISEEWYEGETFYNVANHRKYHDSARDDFYIAYNAIKRAIRGDKLRAVIAVDEKTCIGYFESQKSQLNENNKDWLCKGMIDRETLIDREDLKKWLKGIPIYPSAFFDEQSQFEYLDKNHKNYSPTLALMVTAWLHSKDMDLAGNAPVKQLEDVIKEIGGRFLEDEKLTNTIINNMASLTSPSDKSGRPPKKENVADVTNTDELNNIPNSELIKKHTNRNVLSRDFQELLEVNNTSPNNIGDDELPF
nr:hypothetical protein [uncultured Acinetobacter sp.]